LTRNAAIYGNKNYAIVFNKKAVMAAQANSQRPFGITVITVITVITLSKQKILGLPISYIHYIGLFTLQCCCF
jgi:hypothetical protein